MPLLEDPARLSKSRLRSDLLAHNVALPPANSRKEVYVELHLKHIEQRSAAEFSSDEEDPVEDGNDPEIPDPSALTDVDLKAALLRHGVKVGPVVASTRAVYEKKLRRLLQAGAGDEQADGEQDNAGLYSDSGDEEESEGGEEETVEQSQQEEASGPLSPAPNGASSLSTQAFSITQMVEEMESRRSASDAELSGSHVQEHRAHASGCHQLAVDQPAAKDQALLHAPEALSLKHGTKPPVKPTNGVSKDVFPAQASPTEIYATCRRPIKGAAGRPVQYVFPDAPSSPTTLRRRELERQLVPIHIQIKVFLVVVVLLYLIYVVVEESSLDSVMSLLGSPNQAADMEVYAQETLAVSEQE